MYARKPTDETSSISLTKLQSAKTEKQRQHEKLQNAIANGMSASGSASASPSNRQRDRQDSVQESANAALHKVDSLISNIKAANAEQRGLASERQALVKSHGHFLRDGSQSPNRNERIQHQQQQLNIKNGFQTTAQSSSASSSSSKQRPIDYQREHVGMMSHLTQNRIDQLNNNNNNNFRGGMQHEGSHHHEVASLIGGMTSLSNNQYYF